MSSKKMLTKTKTFLHHKQGTILRLNEVMLFLILTHTMASNTTSNWRIINYHMMS